AVDALADRIVEGGRRFRTNVLSGFEAAGIDIANPFEMLLAIRRIGSKRLETLFGPGEPAPQRLRGRIPIARSHSIEQLEHDGEGLVSRLARSDRDRIAGARLKACVATTDVHEYGKILVESVLRQLEVEIIDGGISTDPNDLVDQAVATGADFIALSSYNGVALQFFTQLKGELDARNCSLPVFIGGKLNRIPDGSNTSLPVDISAELASAGATVCKSVDSMVAALGEIAGPARTKPRRGR